VGVKNTPPPPGAIRVNVKGPWVFFVQSSPKITVEITVVMTNNLLFTSTVILESQNGPIIPNK
jgi:hypothetical protein